MSIANSNVAPAATAAPTSTDKPAMAMVTTLFFMWGFLTCLNDILIPHLKAIFDLSYAKAMLIQFSFFGAYFVFALPSGKLIEWIGYKKAMVGGLLTMGLGALLFVPAASAPSFPLFLAALIILAAGITILQVSANPYVAVLGPERTASSRLNLTQAFNSLGTTLAPWFGSLLILSGAPVALDVIRNMSPDQLHDYRLEQASSVKLPYIGLAIALFLLGLVIARFKLPVISSVEPHGKVHDSIWKYPRLVMGAIAIFVYVGAEVAIGSMLVNYMSQPNIGNISIQLAAKFVSLYWGGAMIGRFIGSAVLQKIRTGTVSGIFRSDGLSAGGALDGQLRAFGHVEHPAGWVLQLNDVPQHLYYLDRGSRTADRQRLRFAGLRHRGRRDHSRAAGRACRSHRHPSRVHCACAVLPLYSVFRVQK